MTGKIIVNSPEGILEGVKKAADAIKVTLGPSGKCVALEGISGPDITRDGATVAKSIIFRDQAENMGAQLVKNAASLTESSAGDGTSSVSVLIKELCVKGQKALKAGANVNEIKSGMLKAGEWMTDYVKSVSIPIEGDLDKIHHVATISANNDPSVGDLVTECMKQVGVDGVITADLSSSLDTKIEVTTGMKLDRGWSSPMYVNSPESGKCEMEDPYVIVVGERLSNVSQLLPLITSIMNEGGAKPFLIVCDDIDDVVNATLIMNNNQGAIRCCVVKGIDFGDGRKNIMQDIAVATGGCYICSEHNVTISDAKLSHLGRAKKVVVSQDSTIIYEGYGEAADVATRVDILKARMSDPGCSQYDKTKYEKRIANLSGGIGIIRAGGATEAEKLNLKATIEDAILASKSAVSEGCAPGGGYVYLKGSLKAKKDSTFWKNMTPDEKEGAEIVFSSLPVILRTISSNSGVSGDVVIETVSASKKENWGYNAKTKKYCNLLDEGILDSAKVLRVVLENAISTASMVLLTDCVLLDEPEEVKE